MLEHRLVVLLDGDEMPTFRVECDWGTDPDRPCLSIDCSRCQETSSPACLTDHPADAEPVPGCGVQQWINAVGFDAVVVKGLRVSASAEVSWDGSGWVLDCGGGGDGDQ